MIMVRSQLPFLNDGRERVSQEQDRTKKTPTKEPYRTSNTPRQFEPKIKIE
jgi:hypothetical protein